MKDEETRRRFMELRAQGLSFTNISKELGVAKQTLINWNREYEDEIDNLKSERAEELLQEFKLCKEKRLEEFGKRLKMIGEELDKRNYSDIPTCKLLELYLRMQSVVENNIDSPKFKSEVEIKQGKSTRALLDSLSGSF